MSKVLVVDNQPETGILMEIIKAGSQDSQVMHADNYQKALDLATAYPFDLVFCDTSLQALELMAELRTKGNNVPMVITSDSSSLSHAVEATKKGAIDYLPRPFNLDRLLQTVNVALSSPDNLGPKPPKKKKVYTPYQMIGSGESIQKLKEEISKFAATESRVMITGPNGAGKELVARSIHNQSKRKDRHFIEVNCAAIPLHLIEKELFGSEKGAFTGADYPSKGKFEIAQGGTLFLDEIGDMPLEAQAKVLRALQEKKITKLGGDKDIPIDVRVIAATNKDLRHEIQEGRFREDLYHRLAVIVVKVPSLNSRREDIPELMECFVSDMCDRNAMEYKSVTPAAMKMLVDHDWTGNIRELRNVAERLVLLSDSNQIVAGDIIKYVYNVNSDKRNLLGIVDLKSTPTKNDSLKHENTI